MGRFASIHRAKEKNIKKTIGYVDMTICTIVGRNAPDFFFDNAVKKSVIKLNVPIGPLDFSSILGYQVKT